MLVGMKAVAKVGIYDKTFAKLVLEIEALLGQL